MFIGRDKEKIVTKEGIVIHYVLYISALNHILSKFNGQNTVQGISMKTTKAV